MSDIPTHQAEAHKLGKQVTDKLNTVVLGVEAFRVDHGIYRPLCPMAFSNPINNLKNPSTGELKICRISAFAGSVEGEEEVIILIERVKKGDIHVRFFEHQHHNYALCRPMGGRPRMDRGTRIQFWPVHFEVFSTSRLPPLALSSDWILLFRCGYSFGGSVLGGHSLS